MESSKVPLSGSLKTASDDVRGDITAYNVVGILTYLLVFAFFVGVCAWRALFLPADIWTLWTPWWLLVGAFLGYSCFLFLDFLMIRLRGTMISFLWVMAIAFFVLLIGGGIAFWVWELVVYCYGNHDYFCYNVNGVPWNVWFAFGTYWGMVLFLVIQAVIVGNALHSEKRLLRLTPRYAEVTAAELENQYTPSLMPGVGSLAQAMVLEAHQRKYK